MKTPSKQYELQVTIRGRMTVDMVGTFADVTKRKRELGRSQRGGVVGERVTYKIVEKT